MQKEEFLFLLKNPGKLSDTDFNQFSDIIEKYPLFSVARIMQMIATIDESTALQNKLLSDNAAHINNVKYLRQLIINIKNGRINAKHQLAINNPANQISTEHAGIIEDEGNLTPDSSSLHQLEDDLLSFNYKKDSRKNSINQEPAQQVISEPEKESGLKVTGKRKTDLIEKFITNNPGSIRPDENMSFSANAEISHQIDEDSLITDTLAKIYVKQGLYSKAIYAYEKLILKYPEKSIYFASQIEEIKKLINK